MRAAIGTSLLVITMNSFAGFAGAVAHAAVPWALVGGMAMAAAVGGVVGTLLAGRVSPVALRTGFAWLVLAMALFMAAQQLSGVAAALVGVAVIALTISCW